MRPLCGKRPAQAVLPVAYHIDPQRTTAGKAPAAAKLHSEILSQTADRGSFSIAADSIQGIGYLRSAAQVGCDGRERVFHVRRSLAPRHKTLARPQTFLPAVADAIVLFAAASASCG
jgi:hypothetical protein